jgi:hypothetical protein
VNGVSTRKVNRLVEQLGIDGMTKDRVSALCQALDEQAEAFRPAVGRSSDRISHVDQRRSPPTRAPTATPRRRPAGSSNATSPTSSSAA